MINLEESSDFDSGSDIEDSEDINIEDGHITDKMNKPIDASLVLKKVVKAFYNRPSNVKKRQARNDALRIMGALGGKSKNGKMVIST